MNYLLFIIGFLMYIILGIQKTMKKNPGKAFSYAKYFKDELMTLILAFLSGAACLIMLPDIFSKIIIPGNDNAIRVGFFFCGYLNYSLIRVVITSFAPKKFIQQ